MNMQLFLSPFKHWARELWFFQRRARICVARCIAPTGYWVSTARTFEISSDGGLWRRTENEWVRING